VRFQLQYPTPLAALSFIEPSDALTLAPSYEAAMFADLDRALGELPHEQVAVQWDVAVEIGLLATGFGGKPADLATVVPGLVRCVDQVPEGVPVGMHLCYGDYQHQHFVQPDSLALQVSLVNAVTAAARRAPSWVSFTVPQGRSDEAYFAPLRELNTGPETELAFALVPYHPDDQAAGTTAEQARLIDTYLAQSPEGARDWAICTECGMGRANRDEIPHLLDLHREILAANR
jgi:methionine synthase II (cobalamin-independent)